MTTKSGENLLYEDITFSIRGICFELYKQFGGVFKESIIQNALLKELRSRGFQVENQKRIDILHNGEKVGVYVPDIIVENKVLVELKVKPFLIKEDDRQFWYYLKAADYKLGLLINFGTNKLEIKRRIFDKARVRVNPLLQTGVPRQSASTEKGISIIETIVYFAIFASIAVLGVTVLNYALDSRNTVRELGEVHTQTQRAMELMTEKVRTSNSISASTTAAQLWLNRSASSENPTIFTMSSNAITIQEGVSSAVAITPSTLLVSSLSFTKADNPSPATSSVQISISSGYNQDGTITSGTEYTLRSTAMPL